MKRTSCISLLFSLLFLFSCGDSKFTQLKKDWDNMVDDNFSDSKDSADVVQKDNVNSQKNIKPTTAFNSGNKREDVVSFAKQYIGTKYSFACATPEESFDCSGFLYYVYSHFGYKVPRSSAEYEFFSKQIQS